MACFQVFVDGVQAPYQEYCLDEQLGGPLQVDCASSPAEEYNVTFIVDMNHVDSVSEDGVFVAGAFNDYDYTGLPLSDDDLDGYWETTIALPAGYHEFSFFNGSEWEGSIEGAYCTDYSSGVRFIEVVCEDVIYEACFDSCELCEHVAGCTDAQACNFNPQATLNDGSCNFGGGNTCGPGTIWDEVIQRCLPDPNNCGEGTYWSPFYLLCLPIDNCPEDLDDDGTVAVSDLLLLLAKYGEACEAVLGCTDEFALNFHPYANEDDGSCLYEVLGCTEAGACNFDINATNDDGTCFYSEPFKDCNGFCLNDEDGDGVCDEEEIAGCIDESACNYDPGATDSDCTWWAGCSCEYAEEGYGCDGFCLNDADSDGVCDEFEILGCTDATSTCNFEPDATEDDGSCIYQLPFRDCEGNCLYDSDGDNVCDAEELEGCTDEGACNFQVWATDDNDSCLYPDEHYDCDGACLLDSDDDGVCDELEIEGCMDPDADNYEEEATDDNGTCFVLGCTDEEACNYMLQATTENGSCIYPDIYFDCYGICLSDIDSDGVCDELEIFGCTDSEAFNFDENATEENGECVYSGCTISIACNFDPIATLDDGSCSFYCPGCTDEEACNYDAGAIQDDGSCLYVADIWGAEHFDCEGNCLSDLDDDGVCDESEIVGCQNEDACNYSAEATEEGVCDYESCVGCTYEYACNYDPSFTIGDLASCEFGTCAGCTDPTACNFNPTLTEDDGSCIPDVDQDGICDTEEIFGCTNSDAENYDPYATENDGSCVLIGCADDIACNYDPDVSIANHEACEFPDWIVLGDTILSAWTIERFKIASTGTSAVLVVRSAEENYTNVVCYDLLNDNWIQRGDVIYSTGSTYYFDIDINEDASIVFCADYSWNSPVTGGESGRVKVFAWQNNVWDQLGNTLSGGQNAWFGRSLSCNSDGSMFACWRNDPRRVDIYSFANYQWELLQSIPSDDTGNLYYLNLDISSSGQLLAIRQRNYINGARIDVHSLDEDFNLLTSIDIGSENHNASIGLEINNQGTVALSGSGTINSAYTHGVIVLEIGEDGTWFNKGLPINSADRHSPVSLSASGDEILTIDENSGATNLFRWVNEHWVLDASWAGQGYGGFMTENSGFIGHHNPYIGIVPMFMAPCN